MCCFQIESQINEGYHESPWSLTKAIIMECIWKDYKGRISLESKYFYICVF